MTAEDENGNTCLHMVLSRRTEIKDDRTKTLSKVITFWLDWLE